MDESKFALSCVWCTEGLRLCADSIRSRMYPVRAGGTTGVADMSEMPQRPGEAQGQTVPGVADGAHRLEARVAGDGGAPVRGSGGRAEARGFPPFCPALRLVHVPTPSLCRKPVGDDDSDGFGGGDGPGMGYGQENH